MLEDEEFKVILSLSYVKLCLKKANDKNNHKTDQTKTKNKINQKFKAVLSCIGSRATGDMVHNKNK